MEARSDGAVGSGEKAKARITIEAAAPTTITASPDIQSQPARLSLNIASSWLSMRAKDGRLGWVNGAVSAVNLLNAASLLTLGLLAAPSYVVLFAMTAPAVFGDLSLVLRKTLSRTHRIARHLWRMCLSFFIAAGSGILSLLELLIIQALMFWLAHTYWTGRKRA